ncbi:glycosyltransferase involved in cell wall biosynthesis [Rhodothalassium salexigens DSM 2132]|uniref:Glycosyltransferase involved in cell wall biosynthesis n=1 Tax=Rhodothalassium salexigens DSM 2132 TaxID=1188247 RepID=A0A4R2PKM8_RHOSA|nr:glycosyltransferase family 1 protein [Rhodothalassium salexigens]MBB4211306.1 glycosyltransferase involved in cell wall biosynthesis [Rhodothalassium salexigens DSM 2132]MBK1639370.1 hypothetical protein [Rhodothalassium salexigens DSM 2132]TCP35228.1 glycosyltransferase involved in cell wall biosynthesis [Rhodothalassium salexigens DSM 2132]
MTIAALQQPAPYSGVGGAAKGLRIALVSGNYDYHKDGAAVTLNRLVGHLEAQGAEVLVFSPTAERPAFDSVGEVVSVPSVPVPGRGEYRLGLGLTPRVRRRLAAFAPNVMHIAAPDLLGYTALRYGRRHGLPVVSSFHTRYDTYLQYYGVAALETLGRRYIRHFYRCCDHVYVPSACLAQILREDGIEGNLRLWSRGVESAKISPDARDLNWRRAQGFDDDDVVVAFCGRLVREKGLDAFADTVDVLQQRGVAHRVLVIGDGPERERLAARLPDAVFAGFLSGADLARAYASADLFFNPSQTETFGQVTLEAMASGLACVCADATGSRSLVRAGETGFLAPPRDAAAYADHIARLVREPALRRRMGEASRRAACGYDWQAVMDSMIDNYWDVLDAYRRPVRAVPVAGAPGRAVVARAAPATQARAAEGVASLSADAPVDAVR